MKYKIIHSHVAFDPSIFKKCTNEKTNNNNNNTNTNNNNNNNNNTGLGERNH
jgi:hypothetical protein